MGVERVVRVVVAVCVAGSGSGCGYDEYEDGDDITVTAVDISTATASVSALAWGPSPCGCLNFFGGILRRYGKTRYEYNNFTSKSVTPPESREELLPQLPVIHVDAPGGIGIVVDVVVADLATDLATAAEQHA